MTDYKRIALEIMEKTCDTKEIFDDCDMDLFEMGYLDSFSLLNIIVEIEETVGIKIKPNEIKIGDVNTVNRFVEYFEELCTVHGI